MRPAFVAVYDGLEWRPKSNTPELQQYDLVDAPWPEGFDRSSLPTARFGPGARIRFKWSTGWHTGIVAQAYTYLDNCLRGTVLYTVMETGHLRTVWDNGETEITTV